MSPIADTVATSLRHIAVTPLGKLRAEQARAVVRRVVQREDAEVVDVAAFSSSI